MWTGKYGCFEYMTLGQVVAPIQTTKRKLYSRHEFWLRMHCDLDLCDLTLNQGHVTPLGHSKKTQWCEV